VVFFLGPGLLEVSGHTAGPPGHSVMIWIQVRDVYAEHARLAAAAVPILRELATEPWGVTARVTTHMRHERAFRLSGSGA
jgi:hypothetical protein